jgi:hypothetical protein
VRICLHHGLHAYPGTTTGRDRLPSYVTPSLNYSKPGSPIRAPRSEEPDTPPGLAQQVSLGSLLRGYGNINPLSIDYASRPRLRSRLTQGGLTWPWNPWTSGGRVSHPAFATHACILTRTTSTTRSPGCFTRGTTLPYPPTHLDLTDQVGRPGSCVSATASAVCLSPATLSARDHLTSELLRTLSRVAASKPTSWLSRQPHILFHLAHA